MSTSLYLTQLADARPHSFKLAELLGALSYALDLTEGQPAGHCIRGCYIGTRIGEALNLPDETLRDLYYTLLLKDLGCSSNAARICELYLADDIAFKRDFKTIDTSMSAALRFVFAQTGLEAGLGERIRTLISVVQKSGKIAREVMQTRCHRGADIAGRMGFSQTVQDGILSLDEHWDGSGQPQGLKHRQIPQISGIALLAQIIDVFHAESGSEAALSEAVSRSGVWFDPDLVAAFVTAQQAPDFWPLLASSDLETHVFAMTPALQSAPVDEDYLDDVAAAFADVVDAKSPFTADHSNRVTLYTDMIAEEFGLSPDHRRWLRRAALLHDLGKLAISNQVLDKPGKLDAEEWAAIKRHPAESAAILGRVAAFADIAPIACAHHERLDGKGYPHGLKGDEICLEARILTVADVFDALTAERPYRAAMPIAKALEILDADAGAAFDPACIAALKSGLAKLATTVAA
ncbi:HD domain-containing phosphohydrolase [uncultured Hoeflea sp.]|uniref:HD-GYP domain-containing protein n=1 Tax=uncultured Hoeflea sp. TaxID=538666 RepID=UPI0030EE5142|tara:strand:- start:727 stop:2115 length:1389 start_codon:yes stop_codon:yes gene_type:complete